MSTVDLTADTFEQTVTGNDIVLVDWWAEWCGPCKMFAPNYEKASEKYDDVVFGKVDTEDQQALAAGSGALPARDLESVVDQVRDLDMDEVRAKLAAAEQEQPAQQS